MQAVILAGGYSSRFYPYSKTAHKTMVKIMGKPILEYTFEGLKEAGIKDIILRVGEDGVIKEYFGNGENFGLSIEYIVQKEALGMGEVLLNAQKFLGGEFIFIGGHHVNSKELVKELLDRKKDSKGTILVKQRENPWEYGVVEVKDGKLVRIVEKPEKGKEPSSLGLVSAFLLPLDIISAIKKVKMSEYNFEQEVLTLYTKENPLEVKITKKEILTLKYPWDLLTVKNYLMKNIVGKVAPDAKIAKSAEIKGEVIIEDGVEILEGAKIKGPCFIGKNSLIGNNSILRDVADIGKNCVIGANMEVKNTVIMGSSKTHSGFIGDSIIGENCRIAAQFCTANVRLDRDSVKAVVKGEKVDTGLKSLGTIIGSNVKIGIKSSTMPGVIIGNNAVIGPSTIVQKNVGDNTKYYSKFQEIVTKKNEKQKIVLFDIDYTLFNTDHFKSTSLKEYSLYGETRDVLKKLSEISELGIFSQGEHDFQKAKLDKTNIHKYFTGENVHIFEKKELKLNDVLVKYKNRKVVLVDDKLNVLHNAKKILPSLYTIWIKRGIYVQNQKGIGNFSPDITVTDLHDIIPFIERL